MTLKLFAGIAIILTIISACGPSQPELAVKKIAVAEELLAKGDTTNALLNLDSIPKLFPEAQRRPGVVCKSVTGSTH